MCWLIKKIFSLIIVSVCLLPITGEPKKEIKQKQVESPYYLVIPEKQIYQEIYENLTWLDENKVCSIEPISESHSTILLFGHNREDVFHFLYELEKGDYIFLEHGIEKEKYQVIEKKIISTDKKEYLEINEKQVLRMFTCTMNSHTRLFVQAIKIS